MISIRRLQKRFDVSDGVIAAIRSLDLEIAEGELFVIVGASGSGKTTLLRCVAGLESPDGGEGSYRFLCTGEVDHFPTVAMSRRLAETIPGARLVRELPSLGSRAIRAKTARGVAKTLQDVRAEFCRDEDFLHFRD